MAAKKKVLYVITKSNWGGAQRYVYDLATNLPKDKFEVVVATGGNGPLISKLKDASIEVIPLPHLERNINFVKELFSFWDLFKIFRKEKPDVIHLNSSKAGGLGAVAAWLSKFLTLDFKLLTVFTVHGWGFNENRPPWQKKLIRFLSWVGSLFQNKIILIDKPDMRDAERIIPRKKLELIFNGIGEIDFLSRKDARKFFSEKIGKELSDNILLIGTVAELTKNKGLNYLIEATSVLKSEILNTKHEILVIGGGEEHDGLIKHIKSLGLTENVHLLGFVPEAEKYLKGFDIFVLPSLKEGLPYTLLEAMSAGVPLIGTTVGGVTDIIDQHETGLFVTPKDVRGLADVMADLMTDVKLREKLAVGARRKLNLKFNLQDMVEKTINAYVQKK
jgi:glycosyltransferase involved in cell wall biosynthesis